MERHHATWVYQLVDVSIPVYKCSVEDWITTCNDVESLEGIKKILCSRIAKLKSGEWESPDPFE